MSCSWTITSALSVSSEDIPAANVVPYSSQSRDVGTIASWCILMEQWVLVKLKLSSAANAVIFFHQKKSFSITKKAVHLTKAVELSCWGRNVAVGLTLKPIQVKPTLKKSNKKRWKKNVGSTVESKGDESQPSHQRSKLFLIRNHDILFSLITALHTQDTEPWLILSFDSCMECNGSYAASLDSWMGGCLTIVNGHVKVIGFTHLCWKVGCFYSVFGNSITDFCVVLSKH